MTPFAVAAIAFVLAAAPRATFAASLGEHETPRATDLLRAQRLAERSKDRLRLPRPSRRGWAQGGGGWNAAPKSADQEPRVTINVGPPRQAKRKRLDDTD